MVLNRAKNLDALRAQMCRAAREGDKDAVKRALTEGPEALRPSINFMQPAWVSSCAKR